MAKTMRYRHLLVGINPIVTILHDKMDLSNIDLYHNDDDSKGKDFHSRARETVKILHRKQRTNLPSLTRELSEEILDLIEVPI